MAALDHRAEAVTTGAGPSSGRVDVGRLGTGTSTWRGVGVGVGATRAGWAPVDPPLGGGGFVGVGGGGADGEDESASMKSSV